MTTESLKSQPPHIRLLRPKPPEIVIPGYSSNFPEILAGKPQEKIIYQTPSLVATKWQTERPQVKQSIYTVYDKTTGLINFMGFYEQHTSEPNLPLKITSVQLYEYCTVPDPDPVEGQYNNGIVIARLTNIQKGGQSHAWLEATQIGTLPVTTQQELETLEETGFEDLMSGKIVDPRSYPWELLSKKGRSEMVAITKQFGSIPGNEALLSVGLPRRYR